MVNLNVAMIGENDYGRSLGKKGTESDMTYFDIKQDGNTVTLIEPTRFPEKVPPLFYSLYMSEAAIICVKEIDAALGEAMVAVDQMGIKTGWIILRDYHTQDEVAPLIKGTLLENFKFVEDDPAALKEELLELASKAEVIESETGSVPVDHFFNVKGVGAVVLGSVANGMIKKADRVTLFPLGKWAVIRSIQKHDDDADKAWKGDRVGLALKNVGTEDMDRGYVLSTEELNVVDSVKVKITPQKFWKTPLEEGQVLHLGHWMQFIPSKIEAVSETEGTYELELKLEKKLIVGENPKLFVSQLDNPRIRVVGMGDVL